MTAVLAPPCGCPRCAARSDGPTVEVDGHRFELHTAADGRCRWLCTCASSRLRPGRWTDTGHAAYHGWRRHVGLPYEFRPSAARGPDGRHRRIRPGVHDHRTWALRGEDHGASKLCAADVRAIRAAPAEGRFRVSHRELGRRFGVNEDTIASVRSGRTWGHVR